MGKEEREYIALLEDTQETIFKILHALLYHPIYEETIRDHTIFSPYKDCGHDELRLYSCLKVQDDHAKIHNLPIMRFGPQGHPIVSVESLFKWCTTLANKQGLFVRTSEKREDFWDWYILLLRGKRNIKPPEGLEFLRFGSSQNPREIFLFVGMREVYPIETHIRGRLYQQLQEVKAKIGEEKIPVLLENPTRKQMVEYFIELTGIDYKYKTLETYIAEIEAEDYEIEPINRKKQPYRYATAIARDKIIPRLHQRAAEGRK